jgi:hypothetical protein
MSDHVDVAADGFGNRRDILGFAPQAVRPGLGSAESSAAAVHRMDGVALRQWRPHRRPPGTGTCAAVHQRKGGPAPIDS